MPVIHPREEWQGTDPLYLVRGPAFEPERIDTLVVHYTAADNLIDGDPGEDWAKLPAYLRAIQVSYVTSRSYSIGYSFAIDQRGEVWQLRGLDFKCAANAGHNEHTVAVLCLVDGADPASVEMETSIVWLGYWLRQNGVAVAGHPVGHGQLHGAATACPGVGLLHQINEGDFDLLDHEPDEDNMQTIKLYQPKSYTNTFILPTGLHVDGDSADAYLKAGAQLIKATVDHPQMIAGLLKLNGLTQADLVHG